MKAPALVIICLTVIFAIDFLTVRTDAQSSICNVFNVICINLLINILFAFEKLFSMQFSYLFKYWMKSTCSEAKAATVRMN